MPAVLICAPDSLADELNQTVLWREDNERHLAATLEDALGLAHAARPSLVVIDRDLPRSLRLVEDLRRHPSTGATSIVIAARGDMLDFELELLQAGANAVMRLPAGRDWDDRLGRLMQVPVRRSARVLVRLDFQERDATVQRKWGAIVNLSETGMLVEVPGALELGADLDFRFRLPDAEEPVHGTGQVVRHESGGRYGVHFYGIEGGGPAYVRLFAETARG